MLSTRISLLPFYRDVIMRPAYLLIQLMPTKELDGFLFEDDTELWIL